MFPILAATRGWHGLVRAVHVAYDNHLPLELSPDVLWFHLVSQVSSYVNERPEEVRGLLVAHDAGKKRVDVRNDDLTPDGLEGWMATIERQLHPAVAAGVLGGAGGLPTGFGTSGEVERVVHCAAFMDVVREYFELHVHTRCGIPEVHVAGTLEDWRRVRSGFRTLVGRFVEALAPWAAKVDAVLARFEGVFGAEEGGGGSVPDTFWASIYAHHEGRASGERAAVSGWLRHLFWQHHASGRVPPGELARVVAAVPITWHYLGEKVPLTLRAGFVGVRQSALTSAVRPVLGFALVSDALVLQQDDDRPHDGGSSSWLLLRRRQLRVREEQEEEAAQQHRGSREEREGLPAFAAFFNL